MFSKLKNNIWISSLLIGLFGFFSAVLIGVSELFIYNLEELKQIFTNNFANIFTVLMISGLFALIFSFLSYYFGSRISNKVDLKPKEMDNKSRILFVSIVVFVPLIVYLLDLVSSTGNISTFVSLKYNSFNLLSTVLYNGVLEELWFRYGLMFLFIYAIHKVFYSKKSSEVSKKSIIYGAVFASLFLFAIQLSTVMSIYNFNIIILIKTIFSYLLMNLVYSYYCINYGLKWSIVLHILYIVLYVGAYPIIFSLI